MWTDGYLYTYIPFCFYLFMLSLSLNAPFAFFFDGWLLSEDLFFLPICFIPFVRLLATASLVWSELV